MSTTVNVLLAIRCVRRPLGSQVKDACGSEIARTLNPAPACPWGTNRFARNSYRTLKPPETGKARRVRACTTTPRSAPMGTRDRGGGELRRHKITVHGELRDRRRKKLYNTGLANAAAAFDNYATSRRGERKGAQDGQTPFRRSEGSSGVEVAGGVHVDDRGGVVNIYHLSARTRMPPPPREDVRLVDAVAEAAASCCRGDVCAEAARRGPRRGTPPSPAAARTAVDDPGVKLLLVIATRARMAVAKPEARRGANRRCREGTPTTSPQRGRDERAGQAGAVAEEKPTRCSGGGRSSPR